MRGARSSALRVHGTLTSTWCLAEDQGAANTVVLEEPPLVVQKLYSSLPTKHPEWMWLVVQSSNFMKLHGLVTGQVKLPKDHSKQGLTANQPGETQTLKNCTVGPSAMEEGSRGIFFNSCNTRAVR